MRDETKRDAIRQMLRESPEMSDRAIARELGVSNHLVYSVRNGHRRPSSVRNDHARFDNYIAPERRAIPQPEGKWEEEPATPARVGSPLLWIVGVLLVLLILLVFGVVAARRSQPPIIAPAV